MKPMHASPPDRPLRARRAPQAAWAALALGLALPAWGLDAGPAIAEALEPELKLSTTQHPAVPSLSASAGPVDPRPSFETATQTMVWAGKGRIEWGLGVEQRWRPPSWAMHPESRRSDREGVVLFGVAVRTGTHSRLVWQTPTRLGAADSPADGTDQRLLPLDMRRSDAYRTLLRGSLRFELARGTAISIKPRGRKVGVALTSQW